MDLLVELIVWIFKSLLGEDEKSKRAREQMPGGTQPPVPRGPYDYGDGRGITPNRGMANTQAPKPRTLEEILEEVKRSQQLRAKPPAPNSSAPATRGAPAQRTQARPAPRVPAPLMIPAPAAAAVQQQISARHLVSRLDTRMLKEDVTEKEIVRPEATEKRFDRLKDREDQRFRPLSEQSPEQGAEAGQVIRTIQAIGEIQSVQSAQADAQTAAAARQTYGDFFRALRNAPPQSRGEIARRAIVFAEVFGPPKALRRMRRR